MNEIVIFYSKFYRFWWSIILCSVALIYTFIFTFLELEVHFIFHIISAIYYSLLIWATYRPYLKIKNGRIWTTSNLFISYKGRDLKEVILNDEHYIFKLKQCRFFIGVHCMEEEDNIKLKNFLRERGLLIEPSSLF